MGGKYGPIHCGEGQQALGRMWMDASQHIGAPVQREGQPQTMPFKRNGRGVRRNLMGVLENVEQAFSQPVIPGGQLTLQLRAQSLQRPAKEMKQLMSRNQGMFVRLCS